MCIASTTLKPEKLRCAGGQPADPGGASAAGSYAVDVDGAGRTREFRAMVAGLHDRGLRVVLDVVYNHTFHAGKPPHAPACIPPPAPTRHLHRACRLIRTNCTSIAVLMPAVVLEVAF